MNIHYYIDRCELWGLIREINSGISHKHLISIVIPFKCHLPFQSHLFSILLLNEICKPLLLLPLMDHLKRERVMFGSKGFLFGNW
jgi:hypothetical protein